MLVLAGKQPELVVVHWNIAVGCSHAVVGTVYGT